MDDDLCSSFFILRNHFPDDLGKTPTLDFDKNTNFMKYCSNKDSGENKCNTDLDKITVGFLWLLEKYYSMSQNKDYNENITNTFFLYMISWFSYKLKENSKHNFTKINDLYNEHVNGSNIYSSFINDANRFTNLKDVLNKKSDFLNINIEDMSNFYDAFKLICSMHDNFKTRKYDTLSNNAISFVNKYAELKDGSNIEGTLHNQILSALSTNYDNLKKKCKNVQPLPEITASISAQTSRITSSSSSIGNKLFTVLSIFGVIAFFLGISYKYSLFGFRKRAQKQKLREKIKNIKKRINH
ncbi:hypothetical protein YYC_00265 [Plasmodium yoelii 17X]|uniref:YIR protein n=1 Tax=Plasmodium yoelii 17X TaxID=1323249 RepID=V7PX31_PLAYE|nr:hypothetical protein YYC_00265 [Plasmodium yoelii 17X]